MKGSQRIRFLRSEIKPDSKHVQYGTPAGVAQQELLLSDEEEKKEPIPTSKKTRSYVTKGSIPTNVQKNENKCNESNNKQSQAQL